MNWLSISDFVQLLVLSGSVRLPNDDLPHSQTFTKTCFLFQILDFPFNVHLLMLTNPSCLLAVKPPQ